MDQPITNYRSPSYTKMPVDVDQRIYRAIANDDKDEFLRLIKHPDFQQFRDFYKAHIIYNFDALNIGIAIFNGETKGFIDPEDVLNDGLTPLHLAALSAAVNLTEYHLERGDNVDAVCDLTNIKQATPLDLALHAIQRGLPTHDGGWQKQWCPRKSIIELLVYHCEHQRYHLEVVRLLVQNTPNKERVKAKFIECAYKGQLVELAALFLAAPDLFMTPDLGSLEGRLSPFDTIYNVLNSLGKRTEIEEGLLLLLDVFALVGDKLVAYIRLEDPRVWELGLYKEEVDIAFFLREAAQKKLGVLSHDDYFLSFFKPVRPEADQLVSYPPYSLEHRNQRELEGLRTLSFYLKRMDINMDYINRKIRILEPEDATRLNLEIENRLSSMTSLRGLFETVGSISTKGDKHLPQWSPFLSGRNFQPNVRSFSTSAASSKPWFNSKFTPTNGLVNKVMKPTKLQSFFSVSHFRMVAKRMIK